MIHRVYHIFVAGASKGNFEKIVIAEVNPAMVEAIRKAGSITVNTSNASGIVTDTYDKVEIYNPSVAEDLEILYTYYQANSPQGDESLEEIIDILATLGDKLNRHKSLVDVT